MFHVEQRSEIEMTMKLRRLMIAALLVFSAVNGCKSMPGGDLRVRRISDGRTLAQRFDQAYIARSERGDFDVILIADVAGGSRQIGGNTLQPAAAVPVRHLVHIRIFWRPLGGVRGDDTATSNAAIDWLVLTPGADEGSDLIRYRGSGLVAISTGDDGAAVSLRQVRLQPELVRGDMADPIGTAAVSGGVTATWNRPLIDRKIAEIQALTSAR